MSRAWADEAGGCGGGVDRHCGLHRRRMCACTPAPDSIVASTRARSRCVESSLIYTHVLGYVEPLPLAPAEFMFETATRSLRALLARRAVESVPPRDVFAMPRTSS